MVVSGALVLFPWVGTSGVLVKEACANAVEKRAVNVHGIDQLVW